MNKRILCVMLLWQMCIGSEKLYSQTTNENLGEGGIKWTTGLSWEQVKQKAKAEDKMIFVDCYATWCGPCKQMDRFTYTNSEVGVFANSKFISVKLQMDSTGKDEDDVKQWHAQSHLFRENYKVAQFPSFLFFSPNGELANKDFGYRNAEEFIGLLKAALDPNKQYFSILQKYHSGHLPYSDMFLLIQMAKRLNNKELADSITKTYYTDYLVKLNEKDLYTKTNIQFLLSVLKHSNDKWFSLFYNNPNKIDSVMNQKGFARGVVGDVISQEEIWSQLYKNKKPVTDHPDWIKLAQTIQKKYSKNYAERLILTAKMFWSIDNKDWNNATKYFILRIDRYGLDTAGYGKVFLSDRIYNVVFMHSQDKQALNKCIIWMQTIMKSLPDDPAAMDTYANLLYKVGRKDEALKLEAKAAEMDPENSDIQENYLKMKKGEATWVIK